MGQFSTQIVYKNTIIFRVWKLSRTIRQNNRLTKNSHFLAARFSKSGKCSSIWQPGIKLLESQVLFGSARFFEGRRLTRRRPSRTQPNSAWRMRAARIVLLYICAAFRRRINCELLFIIIMYVYVCASARTQNNLIP